MLRSEDGGEEEINREDANDDGLQGIGSSEAASKAEAMEGVSDLVSTVQEVSVADPSPSSGTRPKQSSLSTQALENAIHGMIFKKKLTELFL